jgi:dTDP-4-amino-4,6-dideoxygalactose transaminase
MTPPTREWDDAAARRGDTDGPSGAAHLPAENVVELGVSSARPALERSSPWEWAAPGAHLRPRRDHRPAPTRSPPRRIASRWPRFEEDEVAAVQRVLASGKVNYWTGEEGRAFEQEFANAHGCQWGAALANGTVALEAALHAIGIGAGDEVIVTPRTFVASASTIVMRGARPVFADVDSTSQNITADTALAALTARTKAILCVHLAGWPCDMPAILELAAAHRLWVVEDCAQAHGAAIAGRPVGAFGHIAAFSFCQDKIMTTGGEGGLVVTNDRDLWARTWSYKDHGKSWEAVYNRTHPPGFRWLHESFGTNARMTEVQAAIGRVQLRKLPGWLERRRSNARILLERCRQIPALRVPEPPAHVAHAYYKGYVFVRPERLGKGWDRDRVMAELVERGVPCLAGSCSEVYREKAFTAAGLGPAQALPTARQLGETSLMFPVDHTLDAEAMHTIADAVQDVVTMASRLDAVRGEEAS